MIGLRPFVRLVPLALGLVLGGCVALAPAPHRVNVPVPVECREQVPNRPVMPTETLSPGVPTFELLRAALAEIDRREGYEIQLRVALQACTAPLEARP